MTGEEVNPYIKWIIEHPDQMTAYLAIILSFSIPILGSFSSTSLIAFGAILGIMVLVSIILRYQHQINELSSFKEPIKVLAMRYANGQMSKEEFLERKKVLEGKEPSVTPQMQQQTELQH